MSPAISVVLNTYNRAELVDRAISAVLAQTFTDFELLVVDDGSTDNTADVVANVSDARVRYLRRPNGGLSAARNTGLTAATGDFVAFLDDDDEVLPSWLAGLYSTAGDHASLGVSSCGMQLVESDGSVSVQTPRAMGTAWDDVTGLFQAGTFLARREVLLALGGYDEELPTSHQTELSLRLVPECRRQGLRVTSTPETLIRVNRATADCRGRNQSARLLAGTERIIERHLERLTSAPEVLARYEGIAGVCAARLGDYRAARRWFRRASRHDPVRFKNHMRAVAAAVPRLRSLVWRPLKADLS